MSGCLFGALKYWNFEILEFMKGSVMEIIKGSFTEARVFADDLDMYARAQIQMICDNEAATGSRICVMPDVHPGAVGPIGLTMTIGDRMIPNLLGADIGCGISCVKIAGTGGRKRKIEFQKLDTVIRERVPFGFALRREPHAAAKDFPFEELRCYRHIDCAKAELSLGTGGGGNHFLEADMAEDGSIYLAVHSGSRHLGKEIAEYYVSEGARLLKERGEDVPYPMTYISGELMADFIHDVKTAQKFAMLNRRIILTEVMRGMKLKEEESFSSVHNYVDENAEDGTLILRKGAISACAGERVIIPINMRDGMIIGTGKGNAEWNYSAPHGSGRIMRRDMVKESHTVSEFKKEMKGIYSSCIGADTLDESPFAYRKTDEIVRAIEETVDVIEVLKPIYNYKAGNRR